MDMGDKKFNDKLEEIFSERLSEETPKDSSWNTPSDELWGRIAQNIPQQKKRRRLIWLSLLVALILLLFLLKTCNLGPFQKENNSLPADTATLPTTNQNTVPSQNETEQQKSFFPTPNPPEILSNQSELTTATSTEAPPSSIQSAALNSTEQSLLKAEPVAKDTLSEKLTLVQENPVLQQTYQLDTLAQTEPLLETTDTPNIDTPEFLKSTDSWTLETMIGYAFGLQDFVVNTNTVHLNLNDTRTFSAGFNLEKNLGENWSVGLGMQYSRLAFDANYDVHLSYSEMGERERTDGFAKAYEESLPSLAGSLNTQLLLFRAAGDEVPEGEDVPVAVHLNHTIEYLSIPFFVKYRQTKRRLGWYIRAGLIPGTVIGALDTEHLATHTRHEQLHHESSSFALEKETAIEQNPVTLLYSGSVGMSYKLTPNQQLFIEPGLWGELLPTYPNDALSKKALHLNFSVGFRQKL